MPYSGLRIDCKRVLGGSMRGTFGWSGRGQEGYNLGVYG
jgi:hypothetical protein